MDRLADPLKPPPEPPTDAGDVTFRRQDVETLVGERLRYARKARRMTLSDVEAASDGEFRTSVVGAYERGERGVSVYRLLRLADIYGVSPVDLLPGADIDGRHKPQYPPDAVL